MITSPPSCRHCACSTGCCARERLLKACVRQLLSCGTESITTRGIAEEAEVNHALIAYHFGGMTQLVDMAVQHIETRLHVELVPEINQFTAALSTSRPANMGLVFADACTRLVDFLLTRATQLDFCRCLLAHRSCTHRLYPLYAGLIVTPLLQSLVSFITTLWQDRNLECTAQDACLLANLILAQLLMTPQLFQSCAAHAETRQPDSMAEARAISLIVQSLLGSLQLGTSRQ